MTYEYFKSNDPIDPALLEKVINDLYKSLADTLSRFVPIGFNEPYVLDYEATKTFKTRPKVLNPTYDSVSKGNTNQDSILVPYFGTPLTMNLLKDLGLTTYQTQKLNGTDSFYKAEEVFPYEPTSASIGGMPYKGNSPFIFRGFLGFSNFVQDTNLRTYPSQDGEFLFFKAKRLSVLIPPQTEDAFNITTDTILSEADRFEIEKIDLDDLDLGMSQDSIFDSNDSGFYPSKSLNQDHAVWVVHNPTTLSTKLIAVPWTQDLYLVRGQVAQPNPNWLIDYPGYTYYRCVACVYIDSNGKFKVSNETAWNEFEDTPNSNKSYSKLYQQSSSTVPLVRHSTSTTDRRIIPTYYYMIQSNTNISSKTNYHGLMRHCINGGSNKMYMSYGANNFTTQDQIYLKIGSCELSNGFESFWLSGDLEFPPTTLDNIELDSGGSYVAGQEYYLWVVVNPYSVLGSGINAPKNNLRIKLIASTSPTWTGVDLIWKATNFDYTHKCRVAWVRKASSPTSDVRFTMIDGDYTFGEKTWHTTTSPNLNLISSGVSTGNNYVPVSNSNLFPQNATEIRFELSLNQTSVGDASDQHMALSTSSYGATSGQAVNLTTNPAIISITKGGNLRSTRIARTFSLLWNPTDILYYACRTGAQAGIYNAVLTGFKLPCSVD